MKKTILLPILLLGLTLASCGSNGKTGTKGEFKDLSYEEKLPANEANEILWKAYLNCRSLSSVDAEMSSYYLSNNITTESTSKVKVAISSEGYTHTEVKYEQKRTVQGISYTEKQDNRFDVVYAANEDSTKFVSLTYEVEDKVESLEVEEMSKAEYEAVPSAASLTYVATYMATFLGADVYKAKKGYVAALSEINETHTAIPWGQGYEELIQIVKQQATWTISEDYKVTDFKYVEEHHANRDLITGEWYKDVILYDKDVTNAKALKYDAKQSNAALKSEIMSKAANTLMSTIPAVQGVQGKVEGEVFTPSLEPASVATRYRIKTGVNSYKFGVAVAFMPSEETNALAIGVGASVMNDVFTAGVARTKTVALPGYTVQSIEGQDVNVFAADAQLVTGMLEFTVTSIVDGLQISDVSFTSLL